MSYDLHPGPQCHGTAIDESITSRRAVRSFLRREVAAATLADILTVASRAPSAVNTQPWRVRVLSGAARERLSAAVIAAYDAGDARPERPVAWFGVYRERQCEFGRQFYGSLGIEKDDTEGRREQQRRNFRFYDAPVGLILTIDRRLAADSWLDCGMFVQNIMLAARGRGLDTCPQGCWKEFPHIVARVLSLPEHEALACGIALGYAHPDAIAHSPITDRAPIGQWARFEGFAQPDADRTDQAA